ncbi:helix-turn-helix transcriptional regulator [Bacillus sp. BR3(2024)]|uniref:helix-turn-helix transcriptional regulator n=1 Tax=Bacillus sp. BR3(2024) TaxID=3126755 RepID=UPI003183452E
MLSDADRRKELADFLKSRRARLTPEQFNLPIGQRRKTKGLRREEVAQLTGIGLTWYTWLEQGRDIQVSQEVIESISRVFRLEGEERNHLILLANLSLPSQIRKPIAGHINGVLEGLLDQLQFCPAYVIDEKLNIVHWNKAASVVFGDFGEMDERNRNAVWRCFTSKEYRKLFENWENHAQRLIAQFRATYTQFIGDEWFKNVIEELTERSSEFRMWWSNHEVQGKPIGRKVLLHPAIGTLVMDHVTLQVYDAPELKLTIYQPRIEEDTKMKMKELLKGN